MSNPDQSDDRMFTDSFAPQDIVPDSDPITEPDKEEDELDEFEDLLPKGEPAEGDAQLP